VLARHDSVADVACVGLPDDEMGERLVGLVQLRQGVAGDDALVAALISWCRESLAGYKCPKRVFRLAALPRNQLGKIVRSALAGRPAGG